MLSPVPCHKVGRGSLLAREGIFVPAGNEHLELEASELAGSLGMW